MKQNHQIINSYYFLDASEPPKKRAKRELFIGSSSSHSDLSPSDSSNPQENQEVLELPYSPTLTELLLSPQRSKKEDLVDFINGESSYLEEALPQPQQLEALPPPHQIEEALPLSDMIQSNSAEETDQPNSTQSGVSEVYNEIQSIAEAIVIPSLNHPEVLAYSGAVSNKLMAMAHSLKKKVCPYCLGSSRSEAGHKSCQSFYNRLISIMLVYIENEHTHSTRLTPFFIVEYIRLNFNLDPASLESILVYLQELFNSFWLDFEGFFKSFFKH